MCVDVARDSGCPGGGHKPGRRRASPSGSSVGSAEEIWAVSMGAWCGGRDSIAAGTRGVNHGERHAVPSPNGAAGQLTQNSPCASSRSSHCARAAAGATSAVALLNSALFRRPTLQLC